MVDYDNDSCRRKKCQHNSYCTELTDEREPNIPLRDKPLHHNTVSRLILYHFEESLWRIRNSLLIPFQHLGRRQWPLVSLYPLLYERIYLWRATSVRRNLAAKRIGSLRLPAFIFISRYPAHSPIPTRSRLLERAKPRSAISCSKRG